MSNDQTPNGSEAKKVQSSRRRLKSLSVLLIAAMLAYLFLVFYEPKVPRTRSGPRKGALPHLKNIAVAQINHASLPDNRFAPPTVVNSKGAPVLGWYVRLLNYLDDAERYDQIQFEYPYDHPIHEKLFKGPTDRGYELVPEIDQTINTDGFGLIHFTLNERLFPDNVSLTEDFISQADGLGNTILMGEIEQGLPAWAAPGNARDPALGLKRGAKTFGVSVHDGETAIGFADGSARMLNNDIDPAVLKALSTPNGGEEIKDW